MRYVTGQDGHSDPSRAGVKDTRSRWRFDAIEDRAVFQMLLDEEMRRAVMRVDRVAFWGKYHREREAYIAAVTLCLKWGRRPSRMLCL